jgi:hypothetical protein
VYIEVEDDTEDGGIGVEIDDALVHVFSLMNFCVTRPTTPEGEIPFLA